MNKIDTCGMSCPQPVLMTKNIRTKHQWSRYNSR